MYSTCLHCTRDLGENNILETLPVGRRVAFDAAQGRLWVVCRSCTKWNLVPFDTRLETIDACERVFRDTRTRFSTDNIGLARARDGMDLVRIGVPRRPEFASWRYGAHYQRRRRKSIGIAVVGGAGSMVAAMVLEATALHTSFILGMAGLYAPIAAWGMLQARSRRIIAVLPGQSSPVRLATTAFHSIHVSVAGGAVTLGLIAGLVEAMKQRAVTVTGPDARLLTRRILGVLNERAGSTRHLSDAIARLETRNIEGWLERLDREAVDFKAVPLSRRWRYNVVKSEETARYPGFVSGVRIAALPPAGRLAIEMWLSEEDEANALAGELALLERQWKEAEALARIADSLALSSP